MRCEPERLWGPIPGTSPLVFQEAEDTADTAIRYGGNYARLLLAGPSPAALVVSPMMYAMQTGKIPRLEELTRIPSEVQDPLITILSEKTLPVPQLNTERQPRQGINGLPTPINPHKVPTQPSSPVIP